MKKLKKLVILNKGQKDDLNLMDKQAMNHESDQRRS